MRQVTPGPTGFAPTVAEPGAIGETGYSPIVRLPSGAIVNAPQIANGTGRADKVVSTTPDGSRVTYEETNGFLNGNALHYLSTESSDKVGATLENATWAPVLNNAPSVGDSSTASARAALAAFTNGRTSLTNPQGRACRRRCSTAATRSTCWPGP